VQVTFLDATAIDPRVFQAIFLTCSLLATELPFYIILFVADFDSCSGSGSLVLVWSSTGYQLSIFGPENLLPRVEAQAGFEVY
jgi:hypothetical protein